MYLDILPEGPKMFLDILPEGPNIREKIHPKIREKNLTPMRLELSRVCSGGERDNHYTTDADDEH